MIFSDNQTKHFYVLDGTTENTHYAVKVLNSGDLRRFVALHSDGNETSDIINKKLVKNAVVNQVKPTYLRKWVVNPVAANTAGGTYMADGTTCYLYFYLENMLGMGMQDRWDRVASYKVSGETTTPAMVMTGLKNDLNLKLNAAGPIKNDFIVTVLDGSMSVDDAESIFKTTDTPDSDSWTEGTDSESLTKGSGTVSGKKYTLVKHEGEYKKTYIYDNVAEDLDVNSLVVYENAASDTFQSLTELDLRMHTNPYAYNVTMSTGITTNNGIEAWSDSQKEIKATETGDVYLSAALKVKAMEMYFLRNRADKYDLNADFYTSILNKSRVTNMSQAYYTIDIDYAFSDTQGYTYHSDKQISVAVPTSTKSDATTIMNKILSIS